MFIFKYNLLKFITIVIYKKISLIIVLSKSFHNNCMFVFQHQQFVIHYSLEIIIQVINTHFLTDTDN